MQKQSDHQTESQRQLDEASTQFNALVDGFSALNSENDADQKTLSLRLKTASSDGTLAETLLAAITEARSVSEGLQKSLDAERTEKSTLAAKLADTQTRTATLLQRFEANRDEIHRTNEELGAQLTHANAALEQGLEVAVLAAQSAEGRSADLEAELRGATEDCRRTKPCCGLARTTAGKDARNR